MTTTATPTSALKVAKIRTILFATDFSPASGIAQTFAVNLAKRFDANLVLAHAIEPHNYALPPEVMSPDDDPMHKLQSLERALRNSVAGIKTELFLAEGSACKVLSSIADRAKADLIVLGTRGRTRISKLVMGSQAEGVLRRATCPVLTVGPHCQVTDPLDGRRLSEVLYAIDFRPESLEALPYAVSFALTLQARLAFLHVLARHSPKNGLAEQQLVSAIKRLLRSLVPDTAGFWEEPQWLVEQGDPAARIVEIANERGSGMVVLGARTPRNVPGAGSHFKAGVAHDVLVRAACPVLTIRGSAESTSANEPR